MVFKAPKLKRKRLTKKYEYLHQETLQKMITRFLTEDRMSEKQLANNLGITVSTLKQFGSKQPSSALRSKINLPLIKLYCLTKFYDQSMVLNAQISRNLK